MQLRHYLTSFAFGFLGACLALLALRLYESRPEVRSAEFYRSEMSTVVSPTTIKKYIDQGNTDYVLVDLRSSGEYQKEHFKSAVNIPASSLSEEQLVKAFEALPKDKEIIVHCYSAYCTLGRQVGEALAGHGIYVHELTVGWSELRYHWDLWNAGATSDAGKDYIVTGGADPSAPIVPCTEGVFGC